MREKLPNVKTERVPFFTTAVPPIGDVRQELVKVRMVRQEIVIEDYPEKMFKKLERLRN